MNERQETAITNHCRFAFETTHPRFATIGGNGAFSVVLTVNSGWE